MQNGKLMSRHFAYGRFTVYAYRISISSSETKYVSYTTASSQTHELHGQLHVHSCVKRGQSTLYRQGRIQDFSSGGSRPKPESGGEVLGEGQQPSHQL